MKFTPKMKPLHLAGRYTTHWLFFPHDNHLPGTCMLLTVTALFVTYDFKQAFYYVFWRVPYVPGPCLRSFQLTLSPSGIRCLWDLNSVTAAAVSRTCVLQDKVRRALPTPWTPRRGGKSASTSEVTTAASGVFRQPGALRSLSIRKSPGSVPL